MASYAAAVTAIRDVCLGAAGATRVVAPGALVEGAYEQEPAHDAKRALVTPTFEAEWSELIPHTQRPSEHSNVALQAVEIQLRTVFSTDEEFMEDDRARVRAEALELLEDVRAALMRAGNLPETLGSDVSFVSGCMHRHLGHRLERADWRGRRLTYLSRFQSVVQFTQTPG